MKAERKPVLTQVSQYCLDTLTVEAFIKSMPKSMDVYSMRFRGGFQSIRKALQIPESIKAKGVISATATAETVDVRGRIDAGMTPEKIMQAIDCVAKCYHIPPAKFHVERVVLMDKNKTSSLSFKRMYKQIKFPNDKRLRKLVLGMTEGKGSNYHDMLSDMSAKKIVCTLAKTEKTIVMCSEEVAKK